MVSHRIVVQLPRSSRSSGRREQWYCSRIGGLLIGEVWATELRINSKETRKGKYVYRIEKIELRESRRSGLFPAAKGTWSRDCCVS